VPDHEDPPPTTLAHGDAKSSDIERVRRDVDNANACVARDEEASLARRRTRRAERTPESPPEEGPSH
jgi:hypothetical protein